MLPKWLSGGRLWLVLSLLVVFGAGCPASETRPQRIAVKLRLPEDQFPPGQIPPAFVEDAPTFVVDFGLADAETLGLRETHYLLDQGEGTLFSAETRFVSWDDNRVVPGPCFEEPVIVTHVETGETFIAAEAGHCIEGDWGLFVDGAYDYLEEE